MDHPLKILFICGSLEPGRDGVGDYTRRLAGECIRQGHAAAAVALNDRHATGQVKTEFGKGSHNLHILRLGTDVAWGQRVRAVQEFITLHDPKWISLQFVPYAYSARGLPLRLAARIRTLAISRRMHVMFHELWVGPRHSRDVNSRMLAYFQRIACRRLCETAAVVHTHLPQYKAQLIKMGFPCRELPVFSNIPYSGPRSTGCYNIEDTKIQLVLFSHSQASAEVAEWVEYLGRDCRKIHRNLFVHLCGRGAIADAPRWTNILEASGIGLKCHGELDELSLSDLISNCDAAVTPLPYHALGKATTIACFIEHGIPIAAPVKSTRHNFPPFFKAQLLTALIDAPTVESIRRAHTRMREIQPIDSISLERIADTFIQDLHGA